VVLIVVLVSKFTAGAWIPAILIPVILVVCKTIKRHYDQVEKRLAIRPGEQLATVRNTVVVTIGRLNQNSLDALAYAKALHPDRLVAVAVEDEDDNLDELRGQWASLNLDIDLEVCSSPFRGITKPILAFIDGLDRQRPDDVITVIIPEVVVHRWWEQLLHNQTALILKSRLLFRPNTIVISIPAQIE
jgi:hypothetical protein